MEKIISNAIAQLKPEYDKGNFDRIIELTNKILNYKSDHPIAFFFRGTARLKKELFEESEADFIQGLSLVGTNEQLKMNFLGGLRTLYEQTEEKDKQVDIMLKIFENKLRYLKK